MYICLIQKTYALIRNNQRKVIRQGWKGVISTPKKKKFSMASGRKALNSRQVV